MDIKKEILKRYKNQNQFAKAIGTTHQRVQYWIDKGWNDLSKSTQLMIKHYMNKED